MDVEVDDQLYISGESYLPALTPIARKINAIKVNAVLEMEENISAPVGILVICKLIMMKCVAM